MRLRTSAGLVIALMAALTAVLAFVVDGHQEDRDREQRDEQVALVGQQIRGTLASAAGALESVRGLFATGPVDERRFRTFTRSVLRAQPAVDTLSFSARVDGDRRARFERRTQRRILDAPAVAGTVRYPLTFAAGPGERPARIGQDIRVDAEQAAALRRARDTGTAQASMPLALPGSGDPGLVVSVPVYAPGAPVATVAQRRRALRGFASGVFHVGRLAETVAVPKGTEISLSEDGRNVVGRVRDERASSLTAPFAGRDWAIRLGAISAPALPLAVAVVLGVGAALTLAVAMLLLLYARRERYALAMVARRLSERDEAEDRFRLLAERSTDLITRNRPDGTFVYVNPAVRDLTGYAPADLVGRSPFGLVHPDDVAAVATAFRRLTDGQAASRGVAARLRRRDGTYAWLEAVVHAIRDPHTGELVEFHAVTRDISERKRLEARLRELADRDELTGLLNRRGFNRALTQGLAGARTDDETGALVMVDLDGFKRVNDELGHAAGDRVLVQVAWALRQDRHGDDVVARFGGDEFALVLPRAGSRRAHAIAEQIVRDIRIATNHLVSASVGVTTYGAHSRLATAAEVVAQADEALYAAKRGGGDRVSGGDGAGRYLTRA